MGKICGRELVYAMVLMFGALTFGYVMAYPSPALPQMEEEFGGLTKFQSSFFNSVTSLCAIFGPFITAALLKCFGRRFVTFVVAVFATVAWLLLLATSKKIFWFGMVCRGLAGLAIGGFSAVIPMYIVELAPPEATGFFGSLNQLGIAIGILFCYIVGNYVSWRPDAIVGASLTICLSILVWLIPESPAVTSGGQDGGQTESALVIFSKKWIGKLVVCMMFMFFQQFSGVNAILTNLTTLFQDAGVELESGIASAISSVAQVVAVLIGGFLIDKLGRKVVWVMSFGGVALMDLLYALCRHDSLKEKFPSWFPIVVIFIFLLAFGLGAGPIPWFIVSEMFPPSIRPPAASAVSVSNWTLAFIVIQVFPYMQDAMKDFGCFMLFAVCSFVGTVFGLFYVKNPEVDQDGFKQYDDLASTSNNFS